jgi:hypothetical protein
MPDNLAELFASRSCRTLTVTSTSWNRQAGAWPGTLPEANKSYLSSILPTISHI